MTLPPPDEGASAGLGPFISGQKNAYGMHDSAQKLNNSMFLKKKLAEYTTGSKHLESGSAPPPSPKRLWHAPDHLIAIQHKCDANYISAHYTNY